MAALPPPYRFPGMDPWIESSGIWGPFHDALVVYMAHDLTSRIRPRYIAVPESRLVIEESSRTVVSDVALLQKGAGPRVAAEPALATEEPLVVLLESEPRKQHFIEIRDVAGGNQVVTIVEVLSPTNKESGQDAREKYIAKQAEVLASDVNLVEVDLLRAGEPTVALPRTGIPPGAYRVVIRRAAERKRAEVYPVALRQRLPRIRVPLRPPDADAALDLQALVERVYREGSLGDLVDYGRPVSPPLGEEDARWARGILEAASR